MVPEPHDVVHEPHGVVPEPHVVVHEPHMMWFRNHICVVHEPHFLLKSTNQSWEKAPIVLMRFYVNHTYPPITFT